MTRSNSLRIKPRKNKKTDSYRRKRYFKKNTAERDVKGVFTGEGVEQVATKRKSRPAVHRKGRPTTGGGTRLCPLEQERGEVKLMGLTSSLPKQGPTPKKRKKGRLRPQGRKER